MRLHVQVTAVATAREALALLAVDAAKFDLLLKDHGTGAMSSTFNR